MFLKQIFFLFGRSWFLKVRARKIGTFKNNSVLREVYFWTIKYLQWIYRATVVVQWLFNSRCFTNYFFCWHRFPTIHFCFLFYRTNFLCAIKERTNCGCLVLVLYVSQNCRSLFAGQIMFCGHTGGHTT